jgi:hypothetical protein
MAGRKKQDVSAPPPKKPRSRRSPAITKTDLEAAIAPLATKDALRTAVAPLATKAELEPLATKAALEPLATKAELYAAIAPLATKDELRAAVAPLATKAELVPLPTRVEMHAALEAWAYRLREIINQDIARHIGAAMEQMQVWISTLDEKYADLPGRVSAIEARLDGNGK